MRSRPRDCIRLKAGTLTLPPVLLAAAGAFTRASPASAKLCVARGGRREASASGRETSDSVRDPIESVGCGMSDMAARGSSENPLPKPSPRGGNTQGARAVFGAISLVFGRIFTRFASVSPSVACDRRMVADRFLLSEGVEVDGPILWLRGEFLQGTGEVIILCGD